MYQLPDRPHPSGVSSDKITNDVLKTLISILDDIEKLAVFLRHFDSEDSSVLQEGLSNGKEALDNLYLVLKKVAMDLGSTDKHPDFYSGTYRVPSMSSAAERYFTSDPVEAARQYKILRKSEIKTLKRQKKADNSRFSSLSYEEQLLEIITLHLGEKRLSKPEYHEKMLMLARLKAEHHEQMQRLAEFGSDMDGALTDDALMKYKQMQAILTEYPELSDLEEMFMEQIPSLLPVYQALPAYQKKFSSRLKDLPRAPAQLIDAKAVTQLNKQLKRQKNPEKAELLKKKYKGGREGEHSSPKPR